VDVLTPAFLVALVLTVAGLLVTAWSGATARRRLHYGSIVAMLACLGWAIVEARVIGAGLVFEGVSRDPGGRAQAMWLEEVGP